MDGMVAASAEDRIRGGVIPTGTRATKSVRSKSSISLLSSLMLQLLLLVPSGDEALGENRIDEEDEAESNDGDATQSDTAADGVEAPGDASEAAETGEVNGDDSDDDGDSDSDGDGDGLMTATVLARGDLKIRS